MSGGRKNIVRRGLGLWEGDCAGEDWVESTGCVGGGLEGGGNWPISLLESQSGGGAVTTFGKKCSSVKTGTKSCQRNYLWSPPHNVADDCRRGPCDSGQGGRGEYQQKNGEGVGDGVGDIAERTGGGVDENEGNSEGGSAGGV